MHTFSEIYELSPKLNCGKCDNPTCRTFCRKLIAGKIEIEKCPYYTEENRKKSVKLLQEGVKISAKSTIILGESGMAYIHPCMVDKKKVAAETRLTSGPEGKVDLQYGFFDIYVVKFALESSGFFKNITFSPRLNLVKFTYDGKPVTVFANGRIQVRQAKDEEEVMEILHLVGRVLWASVICSCCGNASLDCASGGCDDCMDKICPVLAGGPPEPGAKKGKVRETKGSTTFVRLEHLDSGPLFVDGIKIMKSMFEDIRKGKNIDEKMEKVNKYSIDFVVKTERKEDAVIGLLLAGIGTDMQRISEGYAESKDDKALEYAEKAFDAFSRTDIECAKKLQDEILVYMKDHKKSGKILLNATYILNLLPKPLPA